MERIKLLKYIDKLLNIKKINDSSVNGLQIEGAENIKILCGAVDASLKTIEEAAQMKAEMLIVHHGIFWKNNPLVVSGFHKKRIKTALDANLNLYAAHLPLDLHPVCGNNIQICNILGLKNIKPFGNYNGVNIGFYGELSGKIKFNDFNTFYNKKIGRPNAVVKACGFVKKIGVVSGGGSGLFHECAELDIDTFITGEQNYTALNHALESGINIIFGGHYNTEVYGVRALLNMVHEKFKLKTYFIDIPSDI